MEQPDCGSICGLDLVQANYEDMGKQGLAREIGHTETHLSISQKNFYFAIVPPSTTSSAPVI